MSNIKFTQRKAKRLPKQRFMLFFLENRQTFFSVVLFAVFLFIYTVSVSAKIVKPFYYTEASVTFAVNTLNQIQPPILFTDTLPKRAAKNLYTDKQYSLPDNPEGVQIAYIKNNTFMIHLSEAGCINIYSKQADAPLMTKFIYKEVNYFFPKDFAVVSDQDEVTVEVTAL